MARFIIDNYNIYLFQVVTFMFPPAVMYWKPKKGEDKQWFGDNIRLLEAVAHVFNFSFRYLEPPQGEYHCSFTISACCYLYIYY